MQDEIEIEGEKYIKKSLISIDAEKLDNMEYVIIRTYSAGVFAGYLKIRNGKEVELLNARRLWYWSGAASLSQLSQEGIKNSEACKFPCEVKKIFLTEVVEILPCTEQSRLSIKGVSIWKA